MSTKPTEFFSALSSQSRQDMFLHSFRVSSFHKNRRRTWWGSNWMNEREFHLTPFSTHLGLDCGSLLTTDWRRFFSFAIRNPNNSCATPVARVTVTSSMCNLCTKPFVTMPFRTVFTFSFLKVETFEKPLSLIATEHPFRTTDAGRLATTAVQKTDFGYLQDSKSLQG